MASSFAETFKVYLGIDLDKLSFKKLTDKIQGFNKALSGIGRTGGFLVLVNQLDKITQKIIDATERTSEWAVELERTARRSGVSTDVLQRLNILEQQQGLDKGSIASALEHINEIQAKFSGGEGLDEGYLRAGIGIGGTPAQVLERIIDRAQGKSLRYQQLLSQRTGVDTSLFELYGKDISKIASSQIFTPEQFASFKKMNQNFGELHSKWQTLKDKLILLTMPLVEKLLTLANKLLTKVLDQLDAILKDEDAMRKINGILTSIVTVVGVLVLRFLPMFISGLSTIFGFLVDISGIKWFKNLGKLDPFAIKAGSKISTFAKWFFKFLATNFPHIYGLLKEAGRWAKGFIGIFGKLGSGIGLISGKLFKLLGWILTPLKQLSVLLLTIAKRIALITLNILTSPITWIIRSLTLIGAIIGDLVSFVLTGEAKISKGLLEFTNKHFPRILPWIKKIHEFMSDAGQGLKDIIDVGKILFDTAMEWIDKFFDKIDKKYSIITKLNTVLEGWEYTFGGGKERLEAEEKTIKLRNEELNKQLQIKQAIMGLKQVGMNTDYLNAYTGTSLKTRRYGLDLLSNKNNEITVNNTNTFMLDNIDNPEDYANATAMKLSSTQYKNNLYQSAAIFGGNK